MKNLPSLFVSHGSPMMVIEDSPARRFLSDWSSHNDTPLAILVVSAHWESVGGPAVSLVDKPETIYDFGGFSPELYRIKYAAPGAPDAAKQAMNVLRSAGFTVTPSNNRGLDHGAWVPLSLMYPNADIPVFQVSLIHGAGPLEHYRLGAALPSLRSQGVLIIGSGSLTHNLFEYFGHKIDDPAPQWVSEFDSWIAGTLNAGRFNELMDYRTLAPHAERNHPTEDHLLPLFVALGAAGEDAIARRVHSSHSYGVLAMDAYTFSGDASNPGTNISVPVVEQVNI